MKDSMSLFSFKAEFSAQMGAGGDEDGLIAFLLKVLKGRVCTDSAIELQFSPHTEKVADLLVQNRPRQAVFRDSYCEHPPSDRQGFKEGDAVAHLSQVIGSEQACRSCPSGRHLLSILFGNSEIG